MVHGIMRPYFIPFSRAPERCRFTYTGQSNRHIQRTWCERVLQRYRRKELYSYSVLENEINFLRFLRTHPIEYKPFSNEFIPNLSILDVMKVNDVKTIQKKL